MPEFPSSPPVVEPKPGWARRLRSLRFLVEDRSMLPTLVPGDRIWVDPRSYRHRPPARGDLVVVQDPALRGRRLVKRVFGVPGDLVLQVEGELRISDGRRSGSYPSVPETVPLPVGPAWPVEKSVFVVGDRLETSRDSRTFGAVPLGLVIGRPWYRYAPAGRRGYLEAPGQGLSDV